MVLLAGLVGVAFSTRSEDPVSRLLGGNVPVNASAADPLDVSAHNSPTVAVNPRDATNVAIVSRIDLPAFGCELDVSFDGGSHWATSPIPLPEDQKLGCFAPDLAFGPDGRLYVGYTSFAEVRPGVTEPAAVWVVSSVDGGRTLSGPVKAAGPAPLNLRLAADASRAGRVYAVFVRSSGTSSWGYAETGNPITVSRSDDGGRTWMELSTVNAAGRQRVVAPVAAVDGDGRLYVAYLDVGDDRLDYHGGHEGKGGEAYPGPVSLVVARSGDGGRSWTESVVDDRLVAPARWLVLFPPTPSLVADRRSGRLYLAFHDAAGDNSRVRVWLSDDGGNRWGSSAPERLLAGGSSMWLPALAVAGNGRVDIVTLDRHGDGSGPTTAVSLRSSFDHGRSFGSPVRLSTHRFDPNIGFGAQRGMPDLGSRLGVVSTDERVLAVWADTRSAIAETGRQDLAKAVVSVEPRTSGKGALRFGGLALVVAGLVLVVLGSRIERAPGPATSSPR